MPNDWFSAATQPAQPTQQQTQQPRVRPVFTAPPKTPDPMEQQRMQNEQARLRMAQEDQARQASKEQRDAQKDALDIEKRRRDLAPAAEGTEAERTAAFLSTRLAGGISELGRLQKADPSAMRPTWGVEAVRTVLGDTAANYLTDTERQQVIAAQTDMVDALLTLGTGAAYTKEQIEGYRRAYFPQLGDDANTVDAKQQKLRLALEAARVKAGRSAGQIDAAMEAAGLTQPGQPDDNQNDGAVIGGSAASDPNNPPPPGRPSPEQLKAQYPDAQKFLFDDQGNISGIINSEGQFEQIIEVTPDSQNGTLGQEFLSGVGDVVEAAGDTLGLIGNPLNAGVNAVFGTSLSTDLGQSLRDATGLPDISNPYAKAITQGGVGAMAGTGIAQGASGLVTSGVGRGVINSLLANPGRQVVAGGAAGLSSETARQSGAGPVGQFVAGMAGGAAAFGGANALMNATRRTGPNALAAAATRQNVDLMPADAGGPIARRMSGAASQMPVASGSMVRGAEKAQGQMKNALTRAAESQGNPTVTTDVAGEALRGAGKAMAKRSGQQGARLYERAEKASQGVKSIKPINAVAVIDDNIARLSELKQTNAPLVASLQKLKSDISKGVSVTGLRDARTALSQGTFDGRLRSGQEKAIYKQVIAALSTDVEAGLVSAGKPEAARMFKTADAYWKKRVEHIDQVLEPIIGGNKGGEEIVAAVEAMTRGQRGGNMRLTRLMGELDAKDAGDVRALIVDRIGKATPGAQGAAGGDFSASTFLTNWNKMTPQAKNALFRGELRANLDDIAKLSEATKATQKYANTSGTAGAINGAAIGATAIANPPAAAAILGSQYLTGKLLSSPAFARFLARAPRTDNPAVNKKYIEQLSVIAAREPAIANDARALQESLANAFGGSRLAAQDTEKRQ